MLVKNAVHRTDTKFLEVTKLLGRQVRRPTRVQFGSQTVRLFSDFEPAVNTGPINAQNTRDRLRAFAFSDGLNRAAAAPFQFWRSSKWSTHAPLEHPSRQRIHAFMFHWLRSWQ